MKSSKRSQKIQSLFAAGFAALGYHFILRPWQLSWGATAAEAQSEYIGDELVPGPNYQTTRAITIQASKIIIWPWLVQMGYRRGGFYSYDFLENLMGLDINSSEEIVAEWQTLQPGDEIFIAPETPLRIARFQPVEALVLHTRMNPFNARQQPEATPGPSMDWSWAFILAEIDSRATRLIIRTRAAIQPPALTALSYLVLEGPHFLMERKMLLGIKERAEGFAASARRR